jgi:hypothetical protein
MGFLVAVTLAWGQKPTIELLPSAHQYMHPAAIIDTSFAHDTRTPVIPSQQPDSLYTDSLKAEKEKKRHFQFGLNLDSILRKGEVRKNQVENRPGLIPLLFSNVNPIKLFIHITALN